MNQSSRAATENFVFLNAANNGSLKTNCSLTQERDCLPQGRKTASLKFDLLRLIFCIFTNGGCTCFYEEKTKIIARATRANHKTAASSKIYMLFAQKHGLHLTQLILSYFFEKYGKNAHFFPTGTRRLVRKKKRKISGLQRDSNPWPLRSRCSALPYEL